MLARPEVYIIYKYKYVESGEHNAEIILLDNWKFWHFHKTIKAARWTALTFNIWFVVITTSDQQQPKTYPPRCL